MNVNNIITYNNDQFIIDSEPDNDSEGHQPQTPSQINKSRKSKLEIDEDDVQFKKDINTIIYNDNTDVKLIDHDSGSGEDQKPNRTHYQDNLALKENM